MKLAEYVCGLLFNDGPPGLTTLPDVSGGHRQLRELAKEINSDAVYDLTETDWAVVRGELLQTNAG